MKGSNSGYYTTLSVSDLTGQATSDVIPAGNVTIKTDSTGAVLITGDANTSVVVPDSLLSYSTFPVTFIKRDIGLNNARIGKYAMSPWLQITIPAFVSPDTYQGVITYTLIEN
ncbi:MAG: hypothetical protein GXP45_01215 [bacterium]|nr:hypothetical protein [bacterium]